MILIITDNRRSPQIPDLIDATMRENQLSGMTARMAPRDLGNNLHCYRVNANPSRATQDPYNTPVSYHVLYNSNVAFSALVGQSVGGGRPCRWPILHVRALHGLFRHHLHACQSMLTSFSMHHLLLLLPR